MRSALLFGLLFPLAACTYSVDGGESPRRTDPAQPSVGSVGAPDQSGEESSTPTAAGGTSGTKRAFVTSSAFTGNLASELETSLTGADAADALCQAAADAAMLGGTYQAFIESPTEHATTRLLGIGPWVTTKGVRVFNNKANLTTKPLAEFDVDENGETVYGDAWTGVGDRPAAGDTKASYAYCSDWAGAGGATVGSIGATDQTWKAVSPSSYYSKRTCDSRARLYCFEK